MLDVAAHGGRHAERKPHAAPVAMAPWMPVAVIYAELRVAPSAATRALLVLSDVAATTPPATPRAAQNAASSARLLLIIIIIFSPLGAPHPR